MSIEIRGLYTRLYMRRNIEISVNFQRAPCINAHAQNNICIAGQRGAEVCFLVDWNCRLSFKEDSQNGFAMNIIKL